MAMKKLFIFMGLPGAGKGTLAELLVERRPNEKWAVISTGYLCRLHIEQETELGKKIDHAIKTGNLIPDQLVSDMVQEKLVMLQKAESSVILDGYPRTIGQAVLFDAVLKGSMKDCWECVVVKISVPDAVVIERMLFRLVCDNKQCAAVYSSLAKQDVSGLQCTRCGSSLVKRSDDTLETVQKRVAIYHHFENELISFYLDNGYRLIELDGTQAADTVYTNFANQVGLGLLYT